MEGDELNELAAEQAGTEGEAAETAEAPDADAVEAAEPAEATEAAEGEGEQAEPAPEPVEASPDALVEVDGEKISVAELQERWGKSGMLQADYTRKTQEVADARRKLESEVHEFEGTKAELKAWLQSMHDPDLLEAQMVELFPDAFEQAVERRVQERMQLTQGDERTKDLVQRERRLRIEQATAKSRGERDKAVTEVQRAKQTEAENAAKVQELRVTFGQWNDAAMEAAGLDVKDPDVRQLVVGAVRASAQPGTELTEQHFRDAAAKVAKVAGAKPAAAAAPAKRPVPPKQAALPPSTGGKSTTAPARANGTARPAPGKTKVSMADFMARLQRGEI